MHASKTAVTYNNTSYQNGLYPVTSTQVVKIQNTWYPTLQK